MKMMFQTSVEYHEQINAWKESELYLQIQFLLHSKHTASELLTNLD